MSKRFTINCVGGYQESALRDVKNDRSRTVCDIGNHLEINLSTGKRHADGKWEILSAGQRIRGRDAHHRRAILREMADRGREARGTDAHDSTT